MLVFKNVEKSYSKNVKAIDDLSMNIKKGDFVFLVGPNGAGKSTLLRLISCEERPTTGSIYFNGTDTSRLRLRKIPYIRRKMGIVFQDFKLLPNLSVFDNIAYSLQVIGLPKDKVNKRVDEVLKIIEMTHRKSAYPKQLSGGEQQRTAIGRAIANWPLLILADEPTGNLDPDMTRSVMSLFSRINNAGTTVVMATHDKDIVNKMQRRVIMINKGRLVRDDARGGYSSVLQNG
ncbi:cell division ATP-binding protein FtsE [Clostridium sp. 'deep sea']|uniref:cell division ATP-binding protein FtsE n=1 Tax=Clostridium sp. 'deep sea' TaxID=2779445 RepID=UPI00189668C4|nr:cell division ATP-binding protein FtsE [Clostridium sp. 'deep sea']QOR33815.1 cell division ATP-binding protein FtsE [Clostridium sp. 'deep sea']